MNERNIHGSDRVRTCALRDIQVFCRLLYQRSYTFVLIHQKSTKFPAAVIRTGNQSKMYPRIELQYKDHSADCLIGDGISLTESLDTLFTFHVQIDKD